MMLIYHFYEKPIIIRDSIFIHLLLSIIEDSIFVIF